MSVVTVMLRDMEITTVLALLVAGLLCLGAYVAGFRVGTTRPTAPAADPERVAQEAVLRASLDRLHAQMGELEHQRVSWQGQLHQQVADMRSSTDSLRRETQSLSTALRRPQVRGRWGELHLKRAVELAGLVERCDFAEQVQLADGALRPDLVVHLAGGRHVVVDAKVPLEAYLDATACAGDQDEEEQQLAHLRRHARQLRTHIDTLGSKAYWRELAETPEFVVLFLPAESFLAAALDTDPGLIEHAAGRQVVLATPTTLIALLRTVAHGWTHESLTEQAAEVHRLGRELHSRLRTMGGHLDQVGRALNGAVGHYNSAVGSLETRVLVQARRFVDLAVTGEDLPAPRSVELRAVDRRADPDQPPLDRTVGW